MDKQLKRKRGYGPDVFVRQEPDRAAVVVKTYRNTPLFFRLIGIIQIAWEAFIYSKLKGIEGVPPLIGTPDRFTLLTGYVESDNLRDSMVTPDKMYFEKVTRLIEEMHSRHVVHLDLRNRRNYLMDKLGNPYLVDFASSLYIPHPAFLFNLLSHSDSMGLAKVKTLVNPSIATETDLKAARLGRFFSMLWFPGKATKALKKMTRPLRRRS